MPSIYGVLLLTDLGFRYSLTVLYYLALVFGLTGLPILSLLPVPSVWSSGAASLVRVTWPFDFVFPGPPNRAVLHVTWIWSYGAP